MAVRADTPISGSCTRAIARIAIALTLTWLGLYSVSAGATRVWYEQGVATVAAGYDVQRHTITYRKFYLIATGPNEPMSVAMRDCTEQAVVKTSNELQSSLWDQVRAEAKAAVAASTVASTAAAASSASAVSAISGADKRDGMVDGLIGRATRNFRESFSRCAGRRFDPTVFHLGFVERGCEKPARCASTADGFAGQRAAGAFTLLQQWVDRRDTQHPTLPLNAPIVLIDPVADKASLQVLEQITPTTTIDTCVKQATAAAQAASAAAEPAAASTAATAAARRASAARPNVVADKGSGPSPSESSVLIAAAGAIKKVPVAVRPPLDSAVTLANRRAICIALRTATPPLVDSNGWASEPSAQVAQEQLEALVLRARLIHVRINSSVPRITGVPVQIALRFIDVLNDPVAAVDGLRSDTSAKLMTIQDELARSRVIECVRFESASDPSLASKCTGYVLDAPAIAACLSRGTCNPVFASTAQGNILALVETGGLRAVALDSILPRSATTDWKTVSDAMRQCATQDNQTATAQATCLMDRQLEGAAKAAWDCGKGMSVTALKASTLACAVGHPLPPAVDAAMACTKTLKASQDQLSCIANLALPAATAKMVECQRLSKGDPGDMAVCMATQVAGGDIGVAASCLKESGGDGVSAATCYSANKLPPEAAKLLACRDQTQGDARKFALCAATKVLGGEAGAAAACVQKVEQTHGKSSDIAQCYIAAHLPPEGQALVACASDQREKQDAENFAGCMVGKLASGEVGRAVACLQKSGARDLTDAAVCYAAGNLPPAVAQAITCVQQADGAVGAAGCMGAHALPENLRRPVQCLAESGGDPLGTGACMVSDGLNPDQRIGVECLVSSGGVPITFATCAGGRLALKEVFNCVHKKLFEDQCMGSGNEIVKLAKELGVNLTSHTVVGQLLNAPVDVVKFEVDVVAGAIKDAGHFGQNAGSAVGKGYSDTITAIGKGGTDTRVAAEKAIADAGKVAGNVGGGVINGGHKIISQASTDTHNALKWAGDRSGIHINW